MKKFKTLKAKLIFSSVITLVVALVVDLAVSSVLSYSGMEQNASKDLVSVEQAAELAITDSTNLMKKNVQLAGTLSDIGGDNATSGRWISGIESKKDAYGFKMLYVADGNGKIVSSDDSYSGKDISDADYFKQAKNGKVYLSSPMKDAAGKLMIIAAAPVSNNKYQGVIVGEMDPQSYSNIVSTRVVIGKTGNVFILDKNGVLIANKRPQLVAQQQNFIEMAKTDSTYATSAAVYKKMIAGQTGTDTYAYETGTRICYYHPLAGTDGWSCGAVAPLSEMMAEFYPIVIGMSIAAVILIALGILFTRKLADGVAKPIRACSERLVLLAKGDLHSEVPAIDAADETGDLAKATAAIVHGLRGIIDDETRLLTSMAEGDFNVAGSSEEYDGDFRPIQVSVRKIVDSLNDAFRRINESAAQVAGGAGQVSDGAQLLSQGASEQATSVESLSQTLKTLSTQIESNAENASLSNKKAENVGNELMDGSRRIQELTQAMDGIHSSSTKISKIIKTVQDIAFQTSILALNAAVEAARAGEAGKGFSVVADEVRNLAGKSAEASKETAQMIEEMLHAVESGAEITNQTGQAILSIVGDTKEIISAVDAISEASREQADSIRQVMHSVDSITSVIQTNSATSEESAAASSELSVQANSMKELVSRFHLREDEQQA